MEPPGNGLVGLPGGPGVEGRHLYLQTSWTPSRLLAWGVRHSRRSPRSDVFPVSRREPC